MEEWRMKIVDSIHDKLIKFWIKKAYMGGYGGVMIYYAFYLPSLSSKIQKELKQSGINISEI
jgi:hypothetical protein